MYVGVCNDSFWYGMFFVFRWLFVKKPRLCDIIPQGCIYEVDCIGKVLTDAYSSKVTWIYLNRLFTLYHALLNHYLLVSNALRKSNVSMCPVVNHPSRYIHEIHIYIYHGPPKPRFLEVFYGK